MVRNDLGRVMICCSEGNYPELGVLHRQDLLDLIKSCGKRKDLSEARRIHANILLHRRIFLKDICVRNAILSMYTRCGSLREAREAFDDYEPPMRRNIVSWNTLISGYAENGLIQEAMECYVKIRDEKLCPNKITFMCLLKACARTGCLEFGEYIHSEIKKEGFLVKKCIMIGTALIDMYAKCGALGKARGLFNELSTRNTISWSVMITGYVQCELYEEAISSFHHMKDEGVSPNAAIFTSVLKACGHLGCVKMGEEIHDEVKNQGLLDKDIILTTSLVDMYARCGSMVRARAVFDSLLTRDNISWNALICGYSQHDLHDEALKCFRLMCENGILPDSVTYICVLKACSSIQNLDMGKKTHVHVSKGGLLEKDMILCTALMETYVKCNMLQKAREVFNLLSPARDIVSWNILIVGYVQQGFEDEALKCFSQMLNEKISPDALTFTCILKACGSIGYLDMGKEIHDKSTKQNLVAKDVVLGATLVEMYAKCGIIRIAQQVFDELPVQNLESWVALMAGYAHLGQPKKVLSLFEEMIKQRITPNVETFLALLNACNHGGLVKEGQILFEDISTIYCLMPGVEHYASMVSLFSRAGYFDNAMVVIEKMPSCDYFAVWIAFLGACCKWVNVELGRWAFERLLELDGMCGAAYVYMRNIYAAAGMHAEAVSIEIQRVEMEPSMIVE